MSTTANAPQPEQEPYDMRSEALGILRGLHINSEASRRLANELGLSKFIVERAASRAVRRMDHEPKASRTLGA